MANEYASVSQIKQWLGLSPTDTDDDLNLSIALEAASRQIDDLVGRRFYAAAESRQFTPLDSLLLFTDDYTAITSLATDQDGDGVYETAWAITDYVSEPANAGDLGRPYQAIRVASFGHYTFPVWPDSTQVTATWGYPTSTPAPVVQATIIQAARLFKRKDSPFGIAGSGDLGEVRIIPGGDMGMDKDAEALLKSYRHLAAF